MKICGLTGGIATGKSTVSRWLGEQHGIQIVDLDVLVRQLQTPESWVVRRIARAFPEVVQNGILDREKLGTLIFADEMSRRKLNAVMRWPIQLSLLASIARHWRIGTDLVILDAPLLFETKLDAVCAVNVVVVVSKETQLRRLKNRDDLPEAQALRRIDAQMPLAEKAQRADVVIDNNGSVLDLENQLSTIVVPRLRKRIWLWRLNSLPGSLSLAAALFVGKTIVTALIGPTV